MGSAASLLWLQALFPCIPGFLLPAECGGPVGSSAVSGHLEGLTRRFAIVWLEWHIGCPGGYGLFE